MGSRVRVLWRSLEPRGQLTIVGSALAVVVTLYLLFHYASQPSYAPLVSGVDPSQAGQMSKALDSAGVAYRLANGGTEIDVRSGEESRARIALAEKGLGNGGQVGFEIFDKTSLGTTDFQQKIDYQRALEGELDRAIQQIDGVTGADVQLVLPDETLFSDQGAKASAAVLLTAAGPLDPQSVSGVAHLVAAAVKGLDPANVTITDQTGNLLWPNESQAGGVSAATKLAADQSYAAQLSAAINAMLASTLGPGQAEARVHADLNVDQTTIDKVTYANKGTPLQTQTQAEALKSKGGTPALPSGTAANQAPSYAATSTGASNSNYTNQSGTTVYGVDKTVEKTTVAPGSVRRLDVALLVNQSVPAATVASLKSSVASIAGIVPSRGDTLSVSRIAFAKQPSATPTKSSPLALLKNPLGLVKVAALGLGTLIFLFLTRRALRKREREGVVPEPTWLREIAHGGVPVGELEAGPVRPMLDPANERRTALKQQAEEIAQRQPEQIALQVGQWLNE